VIANLAKFAARRHLSLLILLTAVILLVPGCNFISQVFGSDTEPTPEEQLALFDKLVFEAGFRKVTVITVVDRTADADPNDAARRERQVRAALASYLTRYKGSEVIAPTAELIDEVKQLVDQTGMGMVPADLGRRIRNQIGAEVIVNAIIEDAGRRITIYATEADTGRVLYAETLKDWNYAHFDEEELKQIRGEQ